MPIFLEYIFQFSINNAIPASNSVDPQNFIDNAFTLYVDGPGFDSRRWKRLSFLFFLSFGVFLEGGGGGVVFFFFFLINILIF